MLFRSQQDPEDMCNTLATPSTCAVEHMSEIAPSALIVLVIAEKLHTTLHISGCNVTLLAHSKLLSDLKVEKKIAEELQQAGLLATPNQPRPRDPDYADLGHLTYLSCVIKESMRVHTVSPLSVAASVFRMITNLARCSCKEEARQEASWEPTPGCC